jgi:hypothetical protein
MAWETGAGAEKVWVNASAKADPAQTDRMQGCLVGAFGTGGLDAMLPTWFEQHGFIADHSQLGFGFIRYDQNEVVTASWFKSPESGTPSALIVTVRRGRLQEAH